ncbi:hypothetical protein V6x_07470 [Gimesia chilikensis]|uniref:Uncharacterized protein n=1 Tax=Gimesia chilikensis TaxID=2605989 RepID=A0A517W731_9PLAN|nr:hypothetical protein [Gimesia chilikensis]QDU01069.1 hypothetical protein V6x_07470 [Gimesia chilikensis]
MAKIADILEQLKVLEDRFEQIEDDGDDFDEDRSRIPEMSQKEYQEFLERRSQTDFGKTWTVYRRLMLELVEIYLNATSKQRGMIRRAVRNMINIKCYTMALCDEQSWLILDESGEPLLRSLVGLISMVDKGNELLSQFTLTDLHGQATAVAQIEIDPIIAEIAAISSPSTEHIESGVSTQQFLEEFEPYRFS